MSPQGTIMEKGMNTELEEVVANRQFCLKSADLRENAQMSPASPCHIYVTLSSAFCTWMGT